MENFVGRKGLQLDKETMRRLNKRDDRRAWLQVISHFGAVGITGALLWMTWGTWWALPVFMIHGVLINFLYAAQHEFSHWTVFKSRKLNDIFGSICGFISLYLARYDRYFHFTHHRHTQDWEKDPELNKRAPHTLASYLFSLSSISYWISLIQVNVRHARGKTPEWYLSDKQKAEVVQEARLHLLGYAIIAALSIYFQTWAAVILWLAPMMIMKPVHQLQNIIEHTGMPLVQDTWRCTRTVKTSAVMRWMAWNMQYHTAHHTFPGVPFYNLPELHAEILKATGEEPVTMGYLEFQRDMIQHLARNRSESAFQPAAE